MSHQHLQEAYGIVDNRPVDLLAIFDNRIASLDELANSGRVHYARIEEAHRDAAELRRQRAVLAELIQASRSFCVEMSRPLELAVAWSGHPPHASVARLANALVRIGALQPLGG